MGRPPSAPPSGGPYGPSRKARRLLRPRAQIPPERGTSAGRLYAPGLRVSSPGASSCPPAVGIEATRPTPPRLERPQPAGDGQFLWLAVCPPSTVIFTPWTASMI